MGNLPVYNSTLLNNTDIPKTFENMEPGEVVYYDETHLSPLCDGKQTIYTASIPKYRIACGEESYTQNDSYKVNPPGHDEYGHVSSSIGIVPEKLLAPSDMTTHIVHFRVYINSANWNSVSNIMAEIDVNTWIPNSTPTKINNVSIVTIIGPPPPKAPLPPTLTSLATDPSSGDVVLNFTSTTDGYYKIYRCPSSRNLTNADVIGITQQSNGGSVTYIDSDPMLIPGTQYTYAVAGVNGAGEGGNSNSLNTVYTGQVSGTITQPTTWNSNRIIVGSVTVNSGTTLKISPGAIIKINPGCSITVNGTINANGTSAPILFPTSHQRESLVQNSLIR